MRPGFHEPWYGATWGGYLNHGYAWTNNTTNAVYANNFYVHGSIFPHAFTNTPGCRGHGADGLSPDAPASRDRAVETDTCGCTCRCASTISRAWIMGNAAVSHADVSLCSLECKADASD